MCSSQQHIVRRSLFHHQSLASMCISYSSAGTYKTGCEATRDNNDFMLCLLKFLFLFLFLTFFSPLCPFLLEFRLTPYEWYNPHPCLKGRCSLLINQYSLGNSFWFPVGGFMQQGSTIAPRALSTRCVSGVW